MLNRNKHTKTKPKRRRKPTLIFLPAVYTIQPVVKPVWQQAVSCKRGFEMLICVCVSLCKTVVHGTARNSSDNFPSCPSDNHHRLDDVDWKRGWVRACEAGELPLCSVGHSVVINQSDRDWRTSLYITVRLFVTSRLHQPSLPISLRFLLFFFDALIAFRLMLNEWLCLSVCLSVRLSHALVKLSKQPYSCKFVVLNFSSIVFPSNRPVMSFSPHDSPHHRRLARRKVTTSTWAFCALNARGIWQFIQFLIDIFPL